MKYDYLKRKLNRIVKIAKRLAQRKKQPEHWCSQKCISCLVAEARGVDDDEQRKAKKFGYCVLGIPAYFDSSEDVAMIDAKYEILKLKDFKDWEDN